MDKLVKCEKALAKLALFLKKYHPIFDICMVDFVTNDIFQQVLSFELQQNLLQLSEKDLSELPSRMIKEYFQNGLKVIGLSHCSVSNAI